MDAEQTQFSGRFKALTSHDHFPWQFELYKRFVRGEVPEVCDIPTGLGKTSVIPIWLIALADAVESKGASSLPRRLVYVVNRRTVVDQTTNEVEKLRGNLRAAGLCEAPSRLCVQLRNDDEPLRDDDEPLAISTLRGQFADNREWSADPSRPAVIVGTVDMIGSRLLFSGYGVGFKTRPLHAGFLGQDVLLVHDEAHLEPAFQKLLIGIKDEQERCREFRSFRVMELSATSRSGGEVFGLTEDEKNGKVEEVRKRVEAKKVLHFHPLEDEKKLTDEIANQALAFKDSGRAVLVFVRRVEDVEKVVKKLPKGQTQQLTGTLRGLERDRMADPRKETGCPIFARFLKAPRTDAGENERWKIDPKPGTVYLVCTSAGEVGVNLSGDHLVCDLSTFDSIAQRFGRVNRFGERNDSEIHVVHPTKFEEENELDQRRRKTLELLRQLNGDGSPKALSGLKLEDRLAAFTPTPEILRTSDILFDSWALTTIRGKMPGRPPAEPYLHGLTGWEPPETHVAWREEVGVITGDLLDQHKPEDLLEDYPLKPHELLRDRSVRVSKHLIALAGRRPDVPVWLLDDDGTMEPSSLGKVAEKNIQDRVRNCTVLLPPDAGGLLNGLLNGDSETADDVGDEWSDEKGNRRRTRVWDDDPIPDDMRLIRTIDTKPYAGEEEEETATAGRLYWRWYELPKAADSDGSRTARKAVLLRVHTGDVVCNATRIVNNLPLPDELRNAVILAARFHDLGKGRKQFQRSLGNRNPDNPDCLLAKSGKKKQPYRLDDSYRHEFGSLLDVQDKPEFKSLSDDMKDLVLHLIAAHHGRGRPYFPLDEAFDREPNGKDVSAIVAELPRRFARLQRKYGRWGLAYLESLLRAADYAASAEPSAFVEGGQ